MSTDVATIYIATLVPVAALVLVACVILLANLDTYDPPEYQPPVFEQPTMVLPIPWPEPWQPLSESRRPPIVDAYLGVLEAPSTPAGTPEYNRLANRYALRHLGQMRELVAS